jgi:hypothetical protein
MLAADGVGKSLEVVSRRFKKSGREERERKGKEGGRDGRE